MIQSLPYHEDSASLFEAIADDPWAVFLDSGHPHSAQGRYDIIAAAPSRTLLTRGGMTEIGSAEGVEFSQQDPFALLRLQLQPEAVSDPSGLPFCGGAIGYFSYDLGRRIEHLPALARDGEKLPEMAFGIYDWALVVDHRERQSWLVSAGRDPATALKWEQLVALLSHPAPVHQRLPLRLTAPLVSNLPREKYFAAFERIQRYIHDGDCYQVNLAQRFSAPAAGDPWAAYQELRRANPAPFAAYLNLPGVQILSASPERFLALRGRRVESKPIKGTRPRDHAHPARDEALAKALRNSLKDRAENLMIVDLLRNDLSKSCEIGSVAVPSLFEVESFSSVHHLVSTVTGTLAPHRDAIDLLRGCFPGGSITGAPKLRAMEIIEELEPDRRGVYCGAIGYIGFDGEMDTSIVIRTLVHSGNTVRFWAGGGIVADSCAEDEYQETFDKAAALLRLLQQPDPGVSA